MKADDWYSGAVLHGDRYGRKLGFPTANFDPRLLPETTREGVYSARVRYEGQDFLGALYYGPRITLGESKTVLEIHLIDFSGDLYEKSISFTVGRFVRSPMDFSSTDELIHQLKLDVAAVKTDTP